MVAAADIALVQSGSGFGLYFGWIDHPYWMQLSCLLAVNDCSHSFKQFGTHEQTAVR